LNVNDFDHIEGDPGGAVSGVGLCLEQSQRAGLDVGRQGQPSERLQTANPDCRENTWAAGLRQLREVTASLAASYSRHEQAAAGATLAFLGRALIPTFSSSLRILRIIPQQT
jgi:hypothetical protein